MAAPGSAAPRWVRLGTAAAAALPLAAAGAGVAAFAAQLDDASFMRHYLVPISFAEPTIAPWVLRALAALSAALLLLGAAAVFRWALGHSGRDVAGGALRIVLALALALAVSEAIARRWRRDFYALRFGNDFGGPHARYGWEPRHSSETKRPLRVRPDVVYRFDADGNRAASPSARPDYQAPTVLLAGESIALSYSLPWEEGIAVRLQRKLGVQVVNAAVSAYAADQTALRIEDALPRYLRPLAVVAFFPTLMLTRDLCDFRPRLALRDDGALELVPAADGLLSRLVLREELVNYFPWMGEARLRESLRLAAAIELDLARKVRERGAAPLF
ncbi:MAG TPA: hypothetical protein VN883_02570, partial [Myxococcales bacterium]|nr:hypothetical protein [Myxococcales bacterium]